MLKYEQSRLHPLRFLVAKIFSLPGEFSGSRIRLSSLDHLLPSSRQSLTSLMHALEQTRVRIRQEQQNRTQKRNNELRFWQRREDKVVRETKQPLIERSELLSRCLFESRREAFILRERIDRLSRSYLFLFRFCLLLCVCLALLVVHLSVDFCATRHGSKIQIDIQGRQWQDV